MEGSAVSVLFPIIAGVFTVDAIAIIDIVSLGVT